MLLYFLTVGTVLLGLLFLYTGQVVPYINPLVFFFKGRYYRWRMRDGKNNKLSKEAQVFNMFMKEIRKYENTDHYPRITVETLRRTIHGGGWVPLDHWNFSITDERTTKNYFKVRPRVKNPTNDRAVIYVHGGGFVAGTAKVFTNTVSYAFKGQDVTLFLVEYELAPDAKLFEQIESVKKVFDDVVDQYEEISFMGDSAGGSLILCFIRDYLQDSDKKSKVSAAALFSPWCDLTLEQDSYKRFHGQDSFVSNSFVELFDRTFSMDDRLKFSILKNIQSCQEKGLWFPRLYVTRSLSEKFCDEIAAFVQLVQEKQLSEEVVDVHKEDMIHAYPMFYGFMPESQEDITEAIRFLFHKKLSTA